MSRLYSRLGKLQKELLAAKTEEERERIEDEIADLEDDIDQEESDKYNGRDYDD